MGEFRRLPETSMLGIEHALSRSNDPVNYCSGYTTAPTGKRFRLGNRVFNHLRLLHHIPVLFFVGTGNAQQHAAEAGTTVSIGRRKIGSAVKRSTIGRKKSCQRPSALSADCLHSGLVPAVDIRALVAIN